MDVLLTNVAYDIAIGEGTKYLLTKDQEVRNI